MRDDYGDYGLTQPGPDASPSAWAAYRQAYSDRAMQEHRRHLQTLHAELRAKVRYEDCERALAAFNKVLAVADVHTWDAANAQFKLESWDDMGFPTDKVPLIRRDVLPMRGERPSRRGEPNCATRRRMSRRKPSGWSTSLAVTRRRLSSRRSRWSYSRRRPHGAASRGAC